MEALQEIKKTIGETRQAYEGYQKLAQNKLDNYLDSGNELRVDLQTLLQRYQKLNDDLLKAINKGNLPPNECNVEKIETEINALVSLTNEFIKALRNNPYFPVIESLIEGFEDQISLLNETVEDFKSMLRLSKNERLHNLLS